MTSHRHLTAPRPAHALLAGMCALIVAAATSAQPTPGPRVSTWTPNGGVSMLAIDGNTLYVGGTFDYVGPLTGGFGVVDAADATAINTEARAMGGATAIAADGGGGWFVLEYAADFSSRQTILHVLPSGQRDPSWSPPDVTGTASGLAFVSGRVYVWGFVTAVNGVTRTGIAALDGATGAVLPWNAQVNHPTREPAVLEAAFEGGRGYIGGFFTTIGGEARAGFGAIDAATGAVLPVTLPDDPAPGIVAIAASGSRVYVSGFYAAGIPTLRAYDSDLVPLPGWTPVPTIGEVVATPSAVFHATWSGTTTRVDALEPSTGAALPFSPVTVGHLSNSEVRALAIAHGRLYIGGAFDTVNGQPRAQVVAVDAVTGTPVAWAPAVGDQVMTLAVNATHVAIGGGFRSIGGIAKRNLVTLDLATGRPLTPNAPDVEFTVQAVLRLGEVVVAAGNGIYTNGPRPNVVAYSRQSGALLPWSLAADGNVMALATDGRELFIGGTFYTLSGTPRAGLASVDLQTAALTSWDFGIDGGIQRLQVSGRTLYALGYFTRAQGEPRFNIAAYDTVARQVLPFNPAPGQHSDLALNGNKILLAGSYFPPGGGVSAFRWVDATTGEDTAPRTNVAQPGHRLAAAGSTVYGTTRFTTIEQPERIVATDAATGVAVPFAPGGNLNDAFAASAEYIAVGLASALPPIEFRETMAVYRTPRPGAPRALTATVSGPTVTLGWQPGLPPAATSFAVEVGTTAGGSNVGVFPVGTATRVSGGLAAGTYFARVRSMRGSDTGGASSEAIVTVPAPSTPPGAPGTLTASTANGVVSLSWGAAAGNATTYVVEAGSAAGLTNIGSFATGHLDTTFVTPAPPGTYYVRVRAANAFGIGAPSNEITVVVP